MKKKLFAIALAVLLPLGLLAGSGDVNGDGKINIADIVELVNYLEGHQSEKFKIAEADVNNDGGVNWSDVEVLAKNIMGKDDKSEIKISTKEYLFNDSANWHQLEVRFSANNLAALEGMEYEYLDGCDEWINISGEHYPVMQNAYSKVYHGDISPNTKTLERIGRIVFKNNTYGYRDTITVHTVGYFKTKKKEYHVANQNTRGVQIGFETNLSLEDFSYISAKVITPNADWIHISGVGIEYDNNETGECREALVVYSAFNKNDTIKVISHPAGIPNSQNVYRYIMACQPSGDVIEIPIVGRHEGLQIDVYKSASDRTLPKWIKRLSDRMHKDTLFIRFEVEANTSIDKREDDFYFQTGDGYEVWTHLLQPGRNAPSFAEQKKALKVFYESTNGNNWLNNSNWLSEKPIFEWYGVNNDRRGGYVVWGNYVLRLQLMANNLRGELPSEFSSLLPTCWFYMYSYTEWAIQITDNYLHGKIPEAVKKHPLWNEVGWQVIEQNFGDKDSDLFDYDGFGLKTIDEELDYMVEEDNPSVSVSDIIKHNKLTLVHFAGDICPNWGWFTGITDERVNLFMNYRNKGLGMVMVTSRYFDEPFDPFVDYVKKRHKHGVPKDIHWVKNSFGSIIPHTVGTDYLLDNEGNLIQIYAGSCVAESFCLPRVDSVCRARLGEPEEHEKFVSKYYTSTDYSKDGEVTKMQTATIGDGIDVVFVGEAYLDTEMGEGGVYEQTMQEAMESFFSEEPYKSLRNRFNIYAVKAVSPNDAFVSGITKLAIGGSVEKAFEYAKKAVGDRDNRLMVGIICKPGAIAERSQTFMFEEDGSFASWMFTGTGRYVLTHEMGGHGVAFLLDEYVENYWEEASPDEDQKVYLDEMYAKYGEGANVDWRRDPAQVRWAHFINDTRYSAENIGVYEGACLYGLGCYRPTENSMMRNNDCGFNAPSREAIYKRVMKLSEGDSWTYDYETFVTFDKPAREAYKAAQSRSRARGAETQKRRTESRPPTIYKGTWRDAGKCEKVEYISKPLDTSFKR